jgi:hypothetical protein
MSPAAPTTPFPFIVGCGRSGTTLLVVMLDSHPDMAVPGEAGGFALRLCLDGFGRLSDPNADARPRPGSALPYSRAEAEALLHELDGEHRFQRWGLDPARVVEEVVSAGVSSRPGFVRALYRSYAQVEGKVRAGDKTPDHVLHMPLLSDLFPEARFVHLVRDGRDVALAMKDTSWAPKDPAAAAAHWMDRVTRGREDGRRLGPDRYLEVRYEDLVDRPAEELARICAFIDLSFVASMLDYGQAADRQDRMSPAPHEDASLHRAVTPGLRDWRTQMPAEDLRRFEAVAGVTLEEFGYPLAEPALNAR